MTSRSCPCSCRAKRRPPRLYVGAEVFDWLATDGYLCAQRRSHPHVMGRADSALFKFLSIDVSRAVSDTLVLQQAGLVPASGPIARGWAVWSGRRSGEPVRQPVEGTRFRAGSRPACGVRSRPRRSPLERARGRLTAPRRGSRLRLPPVGRRLADPQPERRTVPLQALGTCPRVDVYGHPLPRTSAHRMPVAARRTVRNVIDHRSCVTAGM